MCDTVIAFGQRGGYFFETPSKRSRFSLPSGLEALFEQNKVVKTHCLVLGIENSYAISYTGSDDLLHLQSNALPPTLKDWLYEKDASGVLVRKLEKLQIVLGPYNESFYASDGAYFRWRNVPAGLEAAFAERRKTGGGWTATPRLVVLGAMQDFFMVTEYNGGSWSLSNHQVLQGVINAVKEKDGGLGLIHNLVLDPQRLGAFVLQSSNGVVLDSHAMPHARASLDGFSESIRKDTEDLWKKEAQEAQNAAELQRYNALLEAQTQRIIAARQLQQQTLAYTNMMNTMALMSMATWFN